MSGRQTKEISYEEYNALMSDIEALAKENGHLRVKVARAVILLQRADDICQSGGSCDYGSMMPKHRPNCAKRLAEEALKTLSVWTNEELEEGSQRQKIQEAYAQLGAVEDAISSIGPAMDYLYKAREGLKKLSEVVV